MFSSLFLISLTKLSFREHTLSMQAGGSGGGGARGLGLYKFFKKNSVAQESIDTNVSWPSNSFRKYFMGPPINFNFLFKAQLYQYFRAVLTVILKFEITKKVNIHNNIKKKYLNKFSKKPLIFFAILKLFYDSKIKLI